MVKCKNNITTANAIKSVRTYVSVSDVVYPKYSLMEPMTLNLSGFSEQSLHL